MKFNIAKIIHKAMDKYRFANGYASRKQASESLGYNAITINRYISNERVPNAETFLDIMHQTDSMEVENGLIKIISEVVRARRTKKD